MKKTLFKSDRVLIDGELKPATVVVKNGLVLSVQDRDYQLAGANLVDYDNLVLMPGLVDSHVHINEPGRTDWEGFDTATHAAAAGGITTVVDMPLNCIPVTITESALQEKLAVVGDKLWIDAAF